MVTVLITGGTGLIGTALTNALSERGYHIIILTRDIDKKTFSKNVSFARWDVNSGYIDPEAIKKSTYIIHLAGANVASERWTEKRKNEIISSRVGSANLLVKAIKEIPNNVKAVISASAIGWYGPDPQIPNPKPFVESLLPSSDFLGSVCEQWENAIMPVNGLGRRLVILRTGVVLSRKGGAYREFSKPLQFGIAPILGTGKQIISWIHIDDLVKMYIDALENEQWQGTYNAVSPEPVSNKSLVIAIAKHKRGKYLRLHVPEFILKVMLGEMSTEILKSATVSSWKAEGEGFDFLFPSIESAVRKLENEL